MITVDVQLSAALSRKIMTPTGLYLIIWPGPVGLLVNPLEDTPALDALGVPAAPKAHGNEAAGSPWAFLTLHAMRQGLKLRTRLLDCEIAFRLGGQR